MRSQAYNVIEDLECCQSPGMRSKAWNELCIRKCQEQQSFLIVFKAALNSQRQPIMHTNSGSKQS